MAESAIDTEISPKAASDERSTADEIAAAAADLFARKGFAATSIREIAEAVGVTKPTLYYHFESKEGLIQHIVLASFASFRDALERADEESLEDSLRAIARANLDFAKRNPSMVELVCRMQQQAPNEVEGDLERLRLEGMAKFGGLFTRAMERGEIAKRDPRLLTIQFLGGLITLITAWLRHRLDDRPLDELADELVDLFFAGARAPASERT
jgi:AcrR family transcriptional regulator